MEAGDLVTGGQAIIEENILETVASNLQRAVLDQFHVRFDPESLRMPCVWGMLARGAKEKKDGFRNVHLNLT